MSEVLDEDVVLRLVTHGASTAMLRTDADFYFGYKVFELDAANAPEGDAIDCSDSPCEILIPAGATMAKIPVSIHDDSADNDREQAEHIEMRVDVLDKQTELVRSGSAVRMTIAAQGNMVAFSLTSDCSSSYELGIEFGILKVPHWGKSCKVLMRSEVVVFLEGFFEFTSHLGDVACREVASPVELFSKCSVSALDASVVFWSGWREDEEIDVELGAGLLELSHELGSTVDLDGFDLEWCGLDEL